MHDRRDEYRRCTRSLVADRGRDGAAGIFDTALSNGLAAIVVARWAGQEAERRGWIRSASALLDVIEANAEPAANGNYELADLEPPPDTDVFGAPLGPTPTRIDPEVLRDAIRRTQTIRHARAKEAEPLEERHIDALVALNSDVALRVSLEYEDIDEYEERVRLADAIERARARTYVDMLSLDELERRSGVDYEEEYVEIEDGERYRTAHECPVCGLEALIESARDGYLGQFPAGTCAVCSYVKSFDIADLEGRDEAIDRAINRPE